VSVSCSRYSAIVAALSSMDVQTLVDLVPQPPGSPPRTENRTGPAHADADVDECRRRQASSSPPLPTLRATPRPARRNGDPAYADRRSPGRQSSHGR